jgi:hypothetical protein
MHSYTLPAPRRNTAITPPAPLEARHPIPATIAAELRPDAREIWRRTRRATATCNALAEAWAGLNAVVEA